MIGFRIGDHGSLRAGGSKQLLCVRNDRSVAGAVLVDVAHEKVEKQQASALRAQRFAHLFMLPERFLLYP
jgi:hypothetical protein